MLNRDDLIDLIIEHLRRTGMTPAGAAKAGGAGRVKGNSPGAKASRGRLFLSEYEILKMISPDVKKITVPKDAILSPLALDSLVLRGIAVERV